MDLAKFCASRRGKTTRFSVHPQRSETIGRSSRCSVRLRDPTVSRIHCRVAFENGRVVVTDLGSSLGIVYRGQSCGMAAIQVGDGFHVGETFVHFEALVPATEVDDGADSGDAAQRGDAFVTDEPAITSGAATGGGSTEPELPAGTQLGKFVIEGRLGRSDRCVVYRARQTDLGRSVALKVLHLATSRTGSPERERFLADLRTAASVADPFLVPVFDIEQTEAVAFAAMEHVLGVSLGEQIDRGRRMKWEQLVPVLADVTQALARLHERGLVHGAVKPTNIFWLAAGGGRLADPRSSPRPRPTEAMTFAAPEQRPGAVVDARTDLYCLGCVAYAALTGEPPLTGSAANARQERGRSRLASLREADPSIPPDLDDLIRVRLLAIDPDLRPAEAMEVHEDLLALVEEPSPDVPAVTMPPTLQPVAPLEARPRPMRRRGASYKSFAARLCAELIVFSVTLALGIVLLLLLKVAFQWDIYALLDLVKR